MRVTHRETRAPGTVRTERVLPPQTAGNCAGLWYLIHFDDGLICWVPAAQTERGS
jgi:hypothetical protein